MNSSSMGPPAHTFDDRTLERCPPWTLLDPWELQTLLAGISAKDSLESSAKTRRFEPSRVRLGEGRHVGRTIANQNLDEAQFAGTAFKQDAEHTANRTCTFSGFRGGKRRSHGASRLLPGPRLHIESEKHFLLSQVLDCGPALFRVELIEKGGSQVWICRNPCSNCPGEVSVIARGSVA